MNPLSTCSLFERLTEQDTEGWCVPRSCVMDLLERRPSAAKDMLAALAERLWRTNGVAADLVFLDLPRRVAKYLLETLGEQDKGAGSVSLGLTQG
jgi:CRP/FNR family cyclic AMP-dependent transcriptional regulator